MKNLIKQYFLFFSEGPFIISTLILVVAIIATAVCLVINENAANTFLNKRAIIFVVIIFINMCLAYFIRKKYITIPGDDDYGDIVLFYVLVTKTGKTMILDKPVWEKGKKYTIIANKDYLQVSDSYSVHGNTKTNCCIEGKYKNSLVSVPVILELKYDGIVDRIELFSILVKNIPISKDSNYQELSLDDYLKIVFKKVNEPNQSNFDEIINLYAQLKISSEEFLNEILDLVCFPEKIFPCITNTKIRLENLTASASRSNG